uniref:Profilin n=1 Tax=Geotrypetes seraphini TaxID=260995 RepID=A0A6P8P9D1_GEOSA|nr:profilin-1 isoform X1 [Geotrypetes seraphini]
MSGWDCYIDSMMGTKVLQDAAIFGLHENNPSLWAGYKSGFLCKSTPQEINMLIGQDRNAILTKGACLGGQKVSVIKDNYIDDGTIDARTKNSCGGPTFAVSISRTKSALIMVVGKEGVHGGTVNTAVSPTVEYLTKSGY